MWHNKVQLLKNGLGFHTTSKCTSKPGNVLRKIMGLNNKKRKFYVERDNPVFPSTNTTFGKTSLETKITGNPKRNNVLNKLFMRHITDIMATGEYSSQLLGFGIEVNKVKVSPDYKCLNVFWIAKESALHSEIEELLKRNAGHLRHELSSLNLMGRVPNITFVKDKNYNKFSEVQEILSRADFGEDYEPVEADSYKSDIEMLLTSLEPDVKLKLKALESNTPLEQQQSTLEMETIQIPSMPQNVLGLDHAAIFQRIKNGMSISKAEHRSADAAEWVAWSAFKETQPVNQDPIAFANHQEQRRAFKAFLQQRQLVRMKVCKAEKNWRAQQDYLEEELREAYEARLQFEDTVEEDDYILEDDTNVQSRLD